MVTSNMMQYFSDLPDSAAIGRLAGIATEPRGVPLFIDGLRAFEPGRMALPFPAGLLDFRSPWTSWRGAVGEASTG
jgi:hypothetical protein